MISSQASASRLNGWYLGLAAAAVTLTNQILEQIGAPFKGFANGQKNLFVSLK
jgi:hypothetical protein